MLSYLNKRQRFWLPIWFVLVAYGFTFELTGLSSLEISAGQFMSVFVAIAVIALYALPAVWSVFAFSKTWQLDKGLLFFSLLTGLFITGWLASFGNELLGQFWKTILSKSVYEDWEAALTAPLVEEGLKTFFALFSLYFWQVFDKKSAFMSGLLTGLGFQIVEDIAYIGSETAIDVNSAIPVALSRLEGLLSSHYLYSALLTLGLYLVFSKAKDLPAWKKYLWVTAPLVLHFIWNSPLNVGGFVSALLTGFSLWLLADAVGYVWDWSGKTAQM